MGTLTGSSKIVGNRRKSLEITDMRDYLEIDYSHYQIILDYQHKIKNYPTK